MNPARAFTIVELVLVITVSVILSAVAIGGLLGYDSWRSAAAVKRIQADLLYARQLAMQSQRRTLCVFDTGAQTYALQQEATPGSGAVTGASLTHPLTEANWSVAMSGLSASLTVSSVSGASGNTFGFDANGMPIESTGAAVSGDVDVTFSDGVKLRVAQHTGIAEIIRP